MAASLEFVQDPAFCKQMILDVSVAMDPDQSKIIVAFSEIDQTIRLTVRERTALQRAVLRSRADRGVPEELPGIRWLTDFCAYVVARDEAPTFARDVFASGIITHFDNALGHGRLRLVHCYCASVCGPHDCRLAQSRLQEALAFNN
jgi:hypothetical protein